MKTSFLTLFLISTAILFGQSGYFAGKVFDSETKEPMVMSPVFDLNQKHVKRTDFDGNFLFKLPVGSYQFATRFVGFHADTTTINVTENDTVFYNFALINSSILNTVTVIAKKNTSSAAATLTAEKKSKTVTDGIGKEEMSDRNVSNAADAVKQVPGATVENGKYVYVRGLSDRYSKTLLNGADIPGLDPNRNSVQMDLFPSSLIQNITVYKSFSPDLPASFTGGLVNINTKEFPDKFTVYFSTKLTYNTQSSFNPNFLTQTTYAKDNFGLGANERAIPDYIFNLSVDDFPSPGTNNEQLDTYGKSFSRDFTPQQKQSGLNQSYTFSIGNSKSLNKEKVYPKMGYFVGASYKKSFNFYTDGVQGRYKLTGNYDEIESLNPELNLSDSRGTESVIWGALGNVSMQMNERNTMSLVVNRFQNGINSTRYLDGQNYADASDLNFQTRTLYYQQRELSNVQLKGQHYLNIGKVKDKDSDEQIKINWIGSYTMSVQKTPDLRFFTNDYILTSDSDTIFDLQPALYSDPSQFYRLMTETNLNTKLDVTVPFSIFTGNENSNNTFQAGVYYLDKYRDFKEKRYDFVSQSGANINYNGSVSEYMADENFNSGDYTNGFMYVQNASEDRNNYIGYQTNYAAYAMTDLELGNNFELRVGARAEMCDIFAKSANKNDKPGSLTNFDVLPSLNSAYHLIKDTLKVRLGYSRTLARPTFRELAPFTSFDFVGGNVFVGNPDLKRTLIDNIDLRIEYYPTYKENIAFGVFAKNFQNPIERAFNPEAANAELTWKNVENARVFGAELEFSKYLGDNGIFKDLKLGGNFTYVKSIVNIPTKEYQVILSQNPNAKSTREMFGQSPFIVNSFITYKNKAGWNANVNFGVSGKQISVVTVGATPNVYQQSRPLLGFNVSKDINNFNIKFIATNLLNSKYINTYNFKGEDYIYSSYTRGTNFSLKVAYNFEAKKK